MGHHRLRWWLFCLIGITSFSQLSNVYKSIENQKLNLIETESIDIQTFFFKKMSAKNCLNSLTPSSIIWQHNVNIGLGNSLSLDGTKPSPKPMLTYHERCSMHSLQHVHTVCLILRPTASVLWLTVVTCSCALWQQNPPEPVLIPSTVIINLHTPTYFINSRVTTNGCEQWMT